MRLSLGDKLHHKFAVINGSTMSTATLIEAQPILFSTMKKHIVVTPQAMRRTGDY